MKRIIYIVAVIIISVFTFTSCEDINNYTGEMSSASDSVPSSLDNIQEAVREAQSAFESGDVEGTKIGISKLVEISEDQLYSKNERMIAEFCAIYINTGIRLDYIIKNDNQWVQEHDVDTFSVLHGSIFVDVINGKVRNNEMMNEYLVGLMQSAREINVHYNELMGN